MVLHEQKSGAQCCFSSICYRVISIYVFGEGSFLALILLLSFTLSQLHKLRLASN